VLDNARVKRMNKQRKRFQLCRILHPDTFIAANISQWQMLHNTNVNQYKSPHIPRVQTGNQSHTPTAGPCKMRPASSFFFGAGVFTPTTGTGYSDAITINPGGNGPTLTINRAEFAAVLVAVQKGNTEIATDTCIY